jgi:hypothetical protein
MKDNRAVNRRGEVWRERRHLLTPAEAGRSATDAWQLSQSILGIGLADLKYSTSKFRWTIVVTAPLEFLMCSSSQASAPARGNSIVTS